MCAVCHKDKVNNDKRKKKNWRLSHNIFKFFFKKSNFIADKQAFIQIKICKLFFLSHFYAKKKQSN